jgi:hypothetical protein
VIGAPDETIGGAVAGAVHILPGSETGLTTANAKSFHQNSPGIPDTAEDGEIFGGWSSPYWFFFLAL